jgi:hypothetical protein
LGPNMSSFAVTDLFFQHALEQSKLFWGPRLLFEE